MEEAGIVISLQDGSEHPFTAEILHEMAKRKLLVRSEGLTVSGGTFRSYWSTTELGRKSKDVEGTERPSFRDYVEGFRRLMFQIYGIQIPDPPLRVSDYAGIIEELKG